LASKGARAGVGEEGGKGSIAEGKGRSWRERKLDLRGLTSKEMEGEGRGGEER